MLCGELMGSISDRKRVACNADFFGLSIVTIASPASDQLRLNNQQTSSGATLPPTDRQRETLHQVAELPRDVGWVLLITGLLSELGAPGVPPIWIIGILILWPRLGAPIGACLQRRTPKLFEGCVRMVSRYAHDLERRYPRR